MRRVRNSRLCLIQISLSNFRRKLPLVGNGNLKNDHIIDPPKTQQARSHLCEGKAYRSLGWSDGSIEEMAEPEEHGTELKIFASL